MKRNIAYGRLVFLLLALLLSIFAGIFLGESLRLSEKPAEYIGLTFSFLAAAVLAVISIIGDPSMLLSGGWRTAWESAKSIQMRLHNLYLIFLLYIIVLILLISTEIVEFMGWQCLFILHNVFAGMSVFGLLVSLALPFELSSIQRDRLNSEIEQRKAK